MCMLSTMINELQVHALCVNLMTMFECCFLYSRMSSRKVHDDIYKILEVLVLYSAVIVKLKNKKGSELTSSILRDNPFKT